MRRLVLGLAVVLADFAVTIGAAAITLQSGIG